MTDFPEIKKKPWRIKIVNVSVESDWEEMIILPETTELLIADLCSHDEIVDHWAGFNVEDFRRFIARRSQKSSALLVPRTSVDAALVGRVTQLLDQIASFAIVHENAPITRHSGKVSALRVVSESWLWSDLSFKNKFRQKFEKFQKSF